MAATVIVALIGAAALGLLIRSQHASDRNDQGES